MNTPGTRTHPTRAQSEVTGTVLLLAVVVIIMAIVGVAVLSTIDTDDDLSANLVVSVTDSNATIAHHGGSRLPAEEVTVTLQSGSTERHSLRTFVETQGDGDGEFSAGERRTRVHNASGTLRVVAVHDPSNMVLVDRECDVPTAGQSVTC